MIALPFDVANLAREQGFSLHDIVIWDKGKSLPWSHHGRFRGVCEHVLLFGKGRLGTFNLQAARDTDELASYWVKYPERYHPDGKAPSDLWHFPIPVQGSWGRHFARHFCPFPASLVSRMIRLTSNPGNIVLDPFAGAGTVPAVASFLARKGFGIEINSAFVKAFDKNGLRRIRAQFQSLSGSKPRARSLRKTIVDLRIQKFPRALYSGMARGDRLNGDARRSVGAFIISKRNVHIGRQDILDTERLASISILVLAQKGSDTKKLGAIIRGLLMVQPLTKFGVEANVRVVAYKNWMAAKFVPSLDQREWYIYRRGQFFRYDRVIKATELRDALRAECSQVRQKVPTIFSQVPLALEIPVPDYAESRRSLTRRP
jgi:hypothetical protein